MAINVGYEVLIGSAVSDDKKAQLTTRILQLLQPHDLSVAYVTTYSAGSTSTNQASVAVGGDSADYGIRLIMDSAVVGDKTVATLLAQLIQVLRTETIALSHAASYTAGDRAYNVTVTIT